MKFLRLAFFSLAFALLALPVQAQLKNTDVFTKYAEPTFGTVYQTNVPLEKALPTAVGQVITIFLGLVGIILLVIVVYAGFLWLTAGGNEKKVEQAKDWIKNGIIGLVIVLSAYLITNFVVNQVLQSVSGGGSTTAQPVPGGGAATSGKQ